MLPASAIRPERNRYGVVPALGAAATNGQRANDEQPSGVWQSGGRTINLDCVEFGRRDECADGKPSALGAKLPLLGGSSGLSH
ncbi:MAG: hypothetical protein IT211_00375 [Armatimonadetes bacterium]|nr:hypothetical protein [Armatimonadota bacterium]